MDVMDVDQEILVVDPDEQDEGEDKEPFAVTFLDYQPENISEGIQHPARLSEGAGLANVKPPPITHKLLIPWDGKTKMSKAQLVAVVYATQANNTFFKCGKRSYRKGFLLGDGTGVGKTRTLVGIAHEAILQNYVTQIVWIVPNQGLVDAAIEEIGKFTDVQCHVFQKCKLEDLVGKHGFFFLTYNDIAYAKTQKKFLAWLDKDYQGMIVFDECHYIKSATCSPKPSVAGTFLFDVQMRHPNCRVVYSSATAASEPHHLMVLHRLHFWGEGAKQKTFKDFLAEMKTMGVAGLELLSMDMKRRGVFLSRVISFADVDVQPLNINLSDSMKMVYRKSSEIFLVLLAKMEEILNDPDRDKKEKRKISSGFHADMLRYFASLMLTAKIKDVAIYTQKKYDSEKSVVLTIQHTGASGFGKKEKLDGRPYSVLEYILRRVYETLKIKLVSPMIYVSKESGLQDIPLDDESQDEDTLDDEDVGDEADDDDEDEDSKAWEEISKIRSILLEISRNLGVESIEPSSKRAKMEEKAPKFLEHSLAWLESMTERFPSMDRKVVTDDFSWTPDDVILTLTNEKLSRLFYEIRPFLPINPLDELTERIADNVGGFPDEIIANGTGRSYFYVCDKKKWTVTNTKSKEEEIKDFMDKEKRIIIISDASSVGVSLHADNTRLNQEQRIHVLLEYPWSPDKLVQTLGRTLRSNSDTTPIYVLAKTDIPSEARFLCVVEERLKQLGAICQGQSQASVLSKHLSTNLTTSAAVNAIGNTIKAIGLKNANHAQLFRIIGMKCFGGKNSKKLSNQDEITRYVSKTFNRLMMLPVTGQQHFFKILTEQLSKMAEDSVFSDINGIDIPSASLNAEVTHLSTSEWKLNAGSVQLRALKVSRVLHFDELQAAVSGLKGSYYRSVSDGICWVLDDEQNNPVVGRLPMRTTYWPYSKEKMLKRLPRAFQPVNSPTLAKIYWDMRVESLEKKPGCGHKQKRIKCKQGICNFGWGTQHISVMCGFTYNIYGLLASCCKQGNWKMRLARIRWTEKETEHRDVGLLLEQDVVGSIKKTLDYELDRETATNKLLEEMGEVEDDDDMSVD